MFTSRSFLVVASKRRSDSLTCFSMAVISSYPVALLITTLNQSTVFIIPFSLFSLAMFKFLDALRVNLHQHSHFSTSGPEFSLISSIFLRIISQLELAVPVASCNYRPFPSPKQRFTTTDLESMRSSVFPAERANECNKQHTLSERVCASFPIDHDRLRSLPLERIEAWLRRREIPPIRHHRQ